MSTIPETEGDPEELGLEDTASSSSSRPSLGNYCRTAEMTGSCWWSDVPKTSWNSEGTPYWSDEMAAVAVELEIPESNRGLEKFLGNSESYFVGAMKRKAVEVCERKLTPAEKEEFRSAKAVEVKKLHSRRGVRAAASRGPAI